MNHAECDNQNSGFFFNANEILIFYIQCFHLEQEAGKFATCCRYIYGCFILQQKIPRKPLRRILSDITAYINKFYWYSKLILL